MKALHNALRELSFRQNSNLSGNVDSLITSMLTEQRIPERILVKSGGRISIIETNQVDWVESAGNYVTLHVGKEKYMIRETMKNMENRLSTNTFSRIHRTVIVNINRIQEIKSHYYGDYVVILQDGTNLPLSRRYREVLIKNLGEI
jgi:two-component system LytT family response regulator